MVRLGAKSVTALDSSVEATVVAGVASVFMSGWVSAEPSLSEPTAEPAETCVYAFAAAWACCTFCAIAWPRCSNRDAVVKIDVWSFGFSAR